MIHECFWLCGIFGVVCRWNCFFFQFPLEIPFSIYHMHMWISVFNETIARNEYSISLCLLRTYFYQYCITLIQCGFIYHPSTFHCYGVFVLGSIALVYTCFFSISICIVVVSGNIIYIFFYGTFRPLSRLRMFSQNHCSHFTRCNIYLWT